MSYNGGGYGQYGHGGSNRYGDSSSYRDRSGGFGGSSRYGGGGGGGRRDAYRDRDSLDYIKLEKPDFSDLPPFEKRFYHEHPAVTARTEQDIEDYRRLKAIHVSGKGVPRPVSTFEEASFPSEWGRKCSQKLGGWAGNARNPTPPPRDLILAQKTC